MSSMLPYKSAQCSHEGTVYVISSDLSGKRIFNYVIFKNIILKNIILKNIILKKHHSQKTITFMFRV